MVSLAGWQSAVLVLSLDVRDVKQDVRIRCVLRGGSSFCHNQNKRGKHFIFWDICSTFRTKNVVLAGFVVPFLVQNYSHVLGLTE